MLYGAPYVGKSMIVRPGKSLPGIWTGCSEPNPSLRIEGTTLHHSENKKPWWSD